MKKVSLITLFSFLVLIFFHSMALQGANPVQTVSSVDLKRYTGKWFEIARYPNWFQKGCQKNITATYTLMDENKIEVLNQCLAENGEWKKAKGRAKVVEKSGGAKLRVTFFWPFYGDYWILDLDAEYQFAVVGEPSRKYLWILSRKNALEESIYDQILQRLQRQGYDTGKLQKTLQEKVPIQ